MISGETTAEILQSAELAGNPKSPRRSWRAITAAAWSPSLKLVPYAVGGERNLFIR